MRSKLAIGPFVLRHNYSLLPFLCAVAVVPLLVSTGAATPGQSATSPVVGFWAPTQPPRAHYEIDCAVEMGEEFCLRGSETVRFVNTTAKPIQTLAITWFKYGRQTLDITANGEGVTLPTPISSFPQDFTLAEPVAPGEPVELEIEFSLSVPGPPQEPNEAGPVTDWPRLWWGFPTQDDYDVKLDVPDTYPIVATSGRYDAQTGRYHAEAVPSFGFFLCKGYEVLEDRSGDVLVRCLYKPQDKKCAELLQETAIDAIDFYRQWLGFYPYRILTILPGMDHPAGGYPAATNIIVIHGMGRMAEKPEVHWRWITAHEIGHQYWSRYVMEKDSPAWLWIGLGIYADREYCRARNLGNQKHRELMARYIDGVRKGLDTTVNRSEEQRSGIEFDFNNVVIHGKGFSIISALDCVLGHDLFDRIHRRCLDEFAGRRLGLHEFRCVCERESGQDLGWFFDQWVNSNKYLAYEIASQHCRKEGKAYTTEVQIRRLGTLRMPVPVTVCFEDGTSQRVFTNRLHDSDTLRFQSSSPLKEVRLDPEGVLPMVVSPPTLRPQDISQIIEELPNVGAGEKALDTFQKAKRSDHSDADDWYRLGLMLYDGRYYQEAMEAFEKVQIHGQNDPSEVSAAITWQGHLFDLLGQRDKAIECYRRALAQSVPPNVTHDQYRIRLNREWIEKRLEEPFRRE